MTNIKYGTLYSRAMEKGNRLEIEIYFEFIAFNGK